MASMNMAPTSFEEATSDLRVVVSDLSCAGWQGSSHWQIEGVSSDRLGQTNYTIRGEATPKFTLTRRTLVGDKLGLEFQSTAGSSTWLTTFTGVDFQTGNTTSCTRNGSGVLRAGLGALLITEDLRDEKMNRQFFGSGLVPAPERCPVFKTWTHVPWLTTDIRDTGMLPWPGTNAGRLQGSDSVTVSGDGFSHTTTSVWDFTALGGPQQTIPPALTVSVSDILPAALTFEDETHVPAMSFVRTGQALSWQTQQPVARGQAGQIEITTRYDNPQPGAVMLRLRGCNCPPASGATAPPSSVWMIADGVRYDPTGAYPDFTFAVTGAAHTPWSSGRSAAPTWSRRRATS